MSSITDKHILTDEHLIAIDLILDNCPTVIFGGSLVLNAVGLLDRPVHDLDLIFPETDSFFTNGFFKISDLSDCKSDGIVDRYGKDLRRLGGKICGIDVCCFRIPLIELEFFQYDLMGRLINMHSVKHILLAKKRFARRTPKHRDDFDYITKMYKP